MLSLIDLESDDISSPTAGTDQRCDVGPAEQNLFGLVRVANGDHAQPKSDVWSGPLIDRCTETAADGSFLDRTNVMARRTETVDPNRTLENPTRCQSEPDGRSVLQRHPDTATVRSISLLARSVREMFGRPWVKITALAAGCAFLAALTVAGVFVWLFIPWAPDPHFPPPAGEVEAYEQDLAYLEGYAEYEKAFDDPVKRLAFSESINEVRRNLKDMTPARFELAVAGTVALADNGHTNISPIGRTRRVNHFPIRSGPFEDGEFVLQSMRDHADLLGAEILAVAEHPIDEVVDAFLPYFGGVERRARFFSHLLIMSPELLHARGFAESPSGARLTFRLPDGAIVDRYLEGLNPQNGERQPYGREVMDYRVPSGEEADWVHLMADRTPPAYLAEPDEPYFYEFLEEPRGAYVRLNSNADTEERSLSDWLVDVLTELSVRRPVFVTVDLRFNGGGTDATAGFARQLPAVIDGGGPVYILISRETFSAAIGAAAQFKKFAADRAWVVGGPVGDRLRFVANGGSPYTLPNSGITAYVWSAWDDYGDGCWEWTECFWLAPFFREPGVGDLDPDIPVAMNFSDYVLNRDAAFAAVLSDFHTKHASAAPR